MIDRPNIVIVEFLLHITKPNFTFIQNSI